MIGAIVFILSLLVLGFCVISPSATQKLQATAVGAWDKTGIGRGFNNWMLGLRDQSAPELYGRQQGRTYGGGQTLITPLTTDEQPGYSDDRLSTGSSAAIRI
jgi:hypothetical protein